MKKVNIFRYVQNKTKMNQSLNDDDKKLKETKKCRAFGCYLIQSSTNKSCMIYYDITTERKGRPEA